MSERLDNELKIEAMIQEKLKNTPSYVNGWYMHLTAENKTAASRNDFVNKLLLFLSFINDDISEIRPEDITFEDVEKYFIKIKMVERNGKLKYSSDSYKQGVWSCLNSFFSYMCKVKKYYPENYMNSIDRPKNKDLVRINQDRILLTEKDFQKILQSVENGAGTHKAKKYQKDLKNRDMCILLLFMSTGMRREALSEIDIDDIDDNILTVIDKQEKRHEYVLNDLTLDYLNKWINDRNKYITDNTNVLFVSKYGKRMSGTAIYDLVEKYCEDALGYKVSPHKLRSGFCSIMYKKTGDIEFVRRAVGHSNISTTQRYIVTKGKERAKASSIMNDILA